MEPKSAQHTIGWPISLWSKFGTHPSFAPQSAARRNAFQQRVSGIIVDKDLHSFGIRFRKCEMVYKRWLVDPLREDEGYLAGISAKKKVSLNGLTVFVITQVIDSTQPKASITEIGHDFIGQSLTLIQLHKRALRVNRRKPGQQILATPKRLQLEPSHIQL